MVRVGMLKVGLRQTAVGLWFELPRGKLRVGAQTTEFTASIRSAARDIDAA